MTWYKLRIGNFELRYTPLKIEIQDFPYCNKDGEILKRVVMPRTQEQKPYFLDSKGDKYDFAFRLIKGIARAKLDKTKEVKNFFEVDSNEVEDLLTEKVYIIDCPLLLEKLQKENTALKFAFSNGNGFKVYLAYVHTSKLYKDILFMSLGTAQKSKLIKEVINQMKNQKAQKLTEITILGINKATAEELLTIEV